MGAKVVNGEVVELAQEEEAAIAAERADWESKSAERAAEQAFKSAHQPPTGYDQQDLVAMRLLWSEVEQFDTAARQDTPFCAIAAAELGLPEVNVRNQVRARMGSANEALVQAWARRRGFKGGLV